MEIELKPMKSRHMRFISEQIFEAAYQQATSPSAMGGAYLQSDLDRLEQELLGLEGKRNYIDQAKILDQPHLNPQSYTPAFTREFPASIENRLVREVVDRLVAVAIGIQSSQSSTLPGGWVAYDKNRLSEAIQDIRNFIAEYVVPTTPIDRPEV